MREKKNALNPKPDLGKARLVRLAGVIALSTVLGLAFNAANPLGVRWSEPEAATTGPRQARVGSPPPATPPPPRTPEPATRASVAAAAPAVTNLPATPPAASLPPPAAAFRAPAPVTWAQTRPLMEAGQVLLVDARLQGAFDAGHIPGAVPLAEGSTAQEINAFREQYGTNRYVVVYCSSTSCSVSFKLAYKLAKDHGFAKVDYMTGGYFEYQREQGLAADPAVSPANAASSGATPAGAAPMPVAWTNASDWLQRGEAVLVDARPAADFAAGHLPGALSLPLDSDARQLAAFAERVGTNRTVVVYGASIGSLATLDHAFRLARELPLRGVRFLPDGYRELAATQVGAAPRPANP